MELRRILKMPKQIENKTVRNLEIEEYKALLEACEILEKGFKKKIYGCTLNPNQANAADVWGISFSFDLSVEGYK